MSEAMTINELLDLRRENATLKADLSKANTKIEQLIEQLHAATEDYANAKGKL